MTTPLLKSVPQLWNGRCWERGAMGGDGSDDPLLGTGLVRKIRPLPAQSASAGLGDAAHSLTGLTLLPDALPPSRSKLSNPYPSSPTPSNIRH